MQHHSAPIPFHPSGFLKVHRPRAVVESLEHPVLCWEGQSLVLSVTRICLGRDQYLAGQQSDRLDQRRGFVVLAVVEGCSALQAPQRAKASDSDEMLFGHSLGAFFQPLMVASATWRLVLSCSRIKVLNQGKRGDARVITLKAIALVGPSRYSETSLTHPKLQRGGRQGFARVLVPHSPGLNFLKADGATERLLPMRLHCRDQWRALQGPLRDLQTRESSSVAECSAVVLAFG